MSGNKSRLVLENQKMHQHNLQVEKIDNIKSSKYEKINIYSINQKMHIFISHILINRNNIIKYLLYIQMRIKWKRKNVRYNQKYDTPPHHMFCTNKISGAH